MDDSTTPPISDEPQIVPRLGGTPLDVVGLVLGPAALAAWVALVDVGLTPEAHRLAGILLLTIIWWITEPVPIAVTGFLSVVLCVVFGAVPVDPSGKQTAVARAFAPFANPTTFFLLGGMFLGTAMTRHGLDRRLALSVLTTRWSGRNPTTVLCSMGVATALVSMWVSNTAATAMTYPVALGMIAELAAASGEAGRGFPRSRYATALLLMTSYAATVGGVSTPIGTTTNVVAMGYFRSKDYFNRPVDFLSWCAVGVPLALMLFAALLAWLRWLGPAGALDMPRLREYLQAQRSRLGPWNRGEVNTAIVFVVVVALWLAPGFVALFSEDWRDWFTQHLPEEAVAMLVPVLLYLAPVDWQRREFTLGVADFRRVDWSTLMLFGAGLSLGTLMGTTGLATAIAESARHSLNTDDVWVITALAIAGGILLSEITSNAATAAALIPVVFALCQKWNVDPLPPLMGVTLGASFGNALLVSTPPNAIVYGSRLIPVRRMVGAGLGLDFLSGIVIWCVLRIAFALGWSPLA